MPRPMMASARLLSCTQRGGPTVVGSAPACWRASSFALARSLALLFCGTDLGAGLLTVAAGRFASSLPPFAAALPPFPVALPPPAGRLLVAVPPVLAGRFLPLAIRASPPDP